MDITNDVLQELEIEAVSGVVPCCFVVTDATPDYRILYANDLFLDMLGYTDYDDLLQATGGCAISYIVPDDQQKVREATAQLEKGSVAEMTFRVYCKDRQINYICQRSRHNVLKDGSEVIFASYFNVDQYEQKARHDEMRMRAAMANVHVAVWECDFEKKENVYTPETARDFDIPEVMEDVPQGLIDSGTVRPESIEALRALYQSVMEGAPFAEAEIAVVHQGETRWLKHRLTTIFDNGKPISAMGTAEDITREKNLLLQMESEMARRTTLESTMRGKGYYDITDDLIIEYDTSRLVAEPLRELKRYSDAVAAVARQVVDPSQSKGFSEMFAPESLLALFEAGQTEIHYEYRRQTPEGDVSWVDTHASLMRQPGSGHVVAFMYTSDINDRKVALEVVDAVTTAEYDYIMLVDATHRSYKLFSHSEDCTALMPEAGEDYWHDLHAYLHAVMDDESAEKMLALRTESAIKARLAQKSTCEFVSNVIDGGKQCIKRICYSYLPQSTQYMLVTCSDITEAMHKEAEQQERLESALLAARQASRAKSEFLSRMSHEIRTPMNAILGMSALAVQAIGNDDEVLDYISKIGISGHYLLTLINDILDMSRIESGKMLLHSAPFSFPEFVNGINTVIYGQAADKNIDYETVVAHGLDDGYIGDAMKLQQILINILGNAVKFTPAGGKVTFSISVVSRNDHDVRLRFAVNDTGCGISEEGQTRIFGAFEQQDTSTTAVYGGTGLGLAISKSLTELMGGTIRVHSIVGVGSEFTVEVPFEIDQSLAVTHTLPHHSFTDLRTLIVDDDLMICEQTAATIKDMGMASEWVTSGEEAVTLVGREWKQNKKFDFILVDWKMPDMDGIETSRRIRTIVGPEVTIIMITAYDWASIEHEAIAAGVNLCISKPMFKSTLVSAFSKAIGVTERERVEAEMQDFDFTGKRVLLAEDHPLNAEIAVKLLQKKNCTVEHVENGLKALERFAATPPGYYDAILMDVRMPIMDGLQAATTIRNWNKEDAKSVPIIAMTANAFDEDIEQSKVAGMDAHLAKPVDPELLYRVLHRLTN